MRLGEILLEEKLLSRERLAQLLRYQREHGGFLGSLLVDLGVLPEVTVVRLLARKLGVPGVCLSGSSVPEEVLGLIPESLARSLEALPFELEDDALRVAVPDPNDEPALRAVSRRTGLRILPSVAVRSRLETAIHRAYGGGSRGSEGPRHVWASQAEAPSATDVPPLIPRSLFFGHDAVFDASLSPDGTRVSFIGAGRRGRALFVIRVSGDSAPVELADDSEVSLNGHSWTSDGAHIVYAGDVKGNEITQVYSLDVRTGVSRPLPASWHGRGRRSRSNARILHVSKNGQALVQTYDTKSYRTQVFRVDLGSGRNTAHPGVSSGYVSRYWADGRGELRLCLRHEEDESFLCARTDSGWRPLLRMPREDWTAIEVAHVDYDGRYAFLLDGLHHTFAHVVRMDLRTGERVVVATPENGDIEGILLDGSEVEGVLEHHPRTELRIFSPELRKEYERLRVETGGVPMVADRSADDRTWLVRSGSDDRPDRYFLYDRNTQAVNLVLDSQPGLSRYELAKMRPVEIPARDGLKLPGYLTLPPWVDETQPLPTVVLLHGGPMARDYWGYDPEHQWLANRGYAVLSVNYRGSTGYGKRIRRAAPYWIAPEMVEDVLDAAGWAIEAGIADSKRVGVMGASYGGYLVLEALGRAPDLFQCGVDLFGVSDWKSLPLSEERKRTLRLDPAGERALLEARSPRFHPERIERPLLVAQGTTDVRVEAEQSSAMVRALSYRGGPVTYLVYEEEGHGFYREESRVSYFAIVEAFLATHLGGRRESFGADLEDEGLRIATGASRIPGLDAYVRASALIAECAGADVRELDLSGFGLRELPPAVRKLDRLERLDLSRNRLTELPREIGLVSSLETLDLSANQLLKLPEELGSLRRLHELDVSENQLSALPRALRAIETLRRIRIQDNPISPKELWGFRPRMLR